MALKVRSEEVADNTSAALYEYTLNSYVPASVFNISKSGLKTISLTQFVLLNLYWTRYWLTPVTGTQVNNSFVTAKLFITTIISFGWPFWSEIFKFPGGSLGSFNSDIVLAGKLTPDSIFAYFPARYVKAVIA